MDEELVSKSYLKNEYLKYSFFPAIISRILNEAPIVAVQKHGKWIKSDTYRDEDGYICYEYTCSECGEIEDDVRNFCRGCGAKMEIDK